LGKHIGVCHAASTVSWAQNIAELNRRGGMRKFRILIP